MKRAALAIGLALLAALPATAAAAPYPDAVTTTPGLVGYWRLGEAGGTSALPAAGGVIGTWSGGVALETPGALSGDADTAANLNGGVLSLGSAWAAAGDLTLEAWIAPTSTGTRYIVSKGSTTTGFQLYLTGTRQPAFSIGTTSGTFAAVSTTALASGTWHHVVGTLSGLAMTLYVDGVAVAARVATGTVRRGTLALTAGRYSQSATGGLIGGLDDVAVYDGALNALQVAAHAAAGIDATPPDVTIASGPPARTAQTTAAFTLVSSTPRISYACSLDGGGFVFSCSAPYYISLSTGTHTVRIQATDRWGRIGAIQSYTWTVDPKAAPDYTPDLPVTTITPGLSSPTSSTTATFTLSATKASVTYACSLDAAAFKSCSSGVSYSGLAAGDHTLRVQSTDRFGQTETTPATFAWSIDRTAPDTQALAVGAAPGATQGSAVFTSTEASSRFECKLGGAGDWSPCASPVAMPAGVSVITVRAIDAAGNADASPATVKLGDAPDGTEPTGAAAFASAAAGLVFTATKGATLSCRLDDGAWKDCASPLAVDGLGWGQHAFAVRAAFSSGTVLESPDQPWTAAAPSPRIAALQFPVLLRRGRDGRARINGRTPALRFALNVTTGVRLTLSRVKHGRAVATVGAWSVAGRQGDVVAPVPDKLVRRLQRGRYQLVARAAGAPVVTRSFAVV